MSDMSFVSLEVSFGSWEILVVILLFGVSSCGWDDGDICSEYSYSELGVSGFFFEELDLEGEGFLGELWLDFGIEFLGIIKWFWEFIVFEKGKE